MKAIQIFNTLCKEGKTVGCVFSNTKYAAGHEKVYTYRILDEMTVQEGDLAVVEKDGKYSFVTITEIHKQSQIDVNANYRYKWILAIVYTEEYFTRMEKEEELIKEISGGKKEIEKNEKKIVAKTYVSQEIASKVSRL